MYSRIVLVLLLLLFMLWMAGEVAGVSLDIAAESNLTHGIVKVYQYFISHLCHIYNICKYT